MQTTAINYRNIVYRPEQFQEILLDKVYIRYYSIALIIFFLVWSNK